jgi:hypothetical protein
VGKIFAKENNIFMEKVNGILECWNDRPKRIDRSVPHAALGGIGGIKRHNMK